MKHSIMTAFALSLSLLSIAAAPQEAGFMPLFPKDGVPEGWVVRQWDDVWKPATDGATWKVENGVLHGSDPRGTWLVSKKKYGDFELRFEWKIPERGNGGLGLRFPSKGDPAFDGLELQMVDPRYYGDAAADIPPTELTGGLYRAVAPWDQRYKPGEWNEYVVRLEGPHVTVTLNGAMIQKVKLDEEGIPVTRHNGSPATPLKDRPRTGHIGFQELSRGGGHVMIRNARIKELSSEASRSSTRVRRPNLLDVDRLPRFMRGIEGFAEYRPSRLPPGTAPRESDLRISLRALPGDA